MEYMDDTEMGGWISRRLRGTPPAVTERTPLVPVRVTEDAPRYSTSFEDVKEKKNAYEQQWWAYFVNGDIVVRAMTADHQASYWVYGQGNIAEYYHDKPLEAQRLFKWILQRL